MRSTSKRLHRRKKELFHSDFFERGKLLIRKRGIYVIIIFSKNNGNKRIKNEALTTPLHIGNQ